MIKYLFLSILLLANVSFAKNSKETDAIKIHLKDATKINRARALPYAKLTKGKSIALSYELITMENLAMIYANFLDKKARPYVENGVQLFHADLVDMKLTPKFEGNFKNNEFPKERMAIDVKGLKRQWLLYLEDDQLEKLYLELVEILDEGRLSYKNQNCLTRHFVESIARGLHNLESHQILAAQKKLPDPKKLSLKFIKLQINSLSWAYSLDKRAFPIQQENVPIFCNDVPPISYK